jgi:hypothetical protein
VRHTSQLFFANHEVLGGFADPNVRGGACSFALKPHQEVLGGFAFQMSGKVVDGFDAF